MSNTRSWPNIAKHGLTIGGKHTFRDWSLLPTEIPVFSQAKPELSYEAIPGASGALDYTEVLTGIVPFAAREGSFTFLVLPDSTWESARSAIANFLAGQKMNCVLDDDPAFFYTGRFWLDEAKSNKGYGTITISYKVEPYKYSTGGQTGDMDWLWNDLFNMTIYYGTFAVAGTKERNLINPSASTVQVDVTCSAPMTVTHGSTTINLAQGYTHNAFTLEMGDNLMTFAGNGNVLVDYALGFTSL